MEISLHDAEEQVIQETDNWIQAVFELEKQAEVWKPEKEILQEAEEEIRQYESMKNVGKIQELFRADYNNVVGLPVGRLYQEVLAAGIDLRK